MLQGLPESTYTEVQYTSKILLLHTWDKLLINTVGWQSWLRANRRVTIVFYTVHSAGKEARQKKKKYPNKGNTKRHYIPME